MLRRLLIATLVVLAAAEAHAASHVGASWANTESEFRAAVDNFEPDDGGWKLFVGSTARVFGVEASYRDLGNHRSASALNAVDVDIKMLDAAVRGIVPIGNVLGLFGKGGWAKISTEGTIDVGGTISRFDRDEWDFFYGVGAQVDLTRRFGVRAEWEKFDDPSLNTLSVGAFFRFGD